MATIEYIVQENWNAGVRYTAVGETEIRITNPPKGDGRSLRWTNSDDDTLPDVDPSICPVVRSGDDDNITLRDGERIWFSGTGSFRFSVTV
jgi:hypothetical protein